jgi:hypothetical protein
MKKIAIAIIICAAVSSPVFADDFFLQAGGGFGKSFGETITGVRYQHDTSRLFSLPSFYEAVYMYWSNSSRSQGLGFARSLVWKHGEFRSFNASIGLMGISRRTENLGTSLQIYFRFAYDFVLSGRKLSLDLIHISNGKLIFGWQGPNSGENFICVSVGLL